MKKTSATMKFAIATALTALFSTTSFANDKVAELQAKNISGDLAVLAMQAQNSGWKLVASSHGTVEMKKTLEHTRVLTGVHNRWKRVTDRTEATAIAAIDKGKIIISRTSEIKNPRHQQQFLAEVETLKQNWQTDTLVASAK